MNAQLTRSHRHCLRLARRSMASYLPCLRLLPREKRQALHAVWAFLELLESRGTPQRETLDARMTTLEDILHAVYAGSTDAHPVVPALREVALRYEVPRAAFEQVLQGVAADVPRFTYDRFDELEEYCDRVGGGLGRLCLHIWGAGQWEAATDLARVWGRALRFTGILTTIGEDARRGRIYLPQEDLARFELTPERLFDEPEAVRVADLIAFECERAERYYRLSEPLAALISPDSRSAFLAMRSVGLALVREVNARREQLDARPIRLPAVVTMGIVLWSWVEGHVLWPLLHSER